MTVLKQLACFIFTVLLLSSTSNNCAANISFQADWNQYTSQEQQTLRRFFEDVIVLLPPRLIDRLRAPVHVEFVALTEDKSLFDMNQNQENTTYAQLLTYLWGQRIQIHSLLLPEISKGPEFAQAFSTHQDYYRFAQALLIHELSHLYDRGDSIVAHLAHNWGVQGLVSGDPQFLDIMGWQNQSFSGEKVQKNKIRQRSPDLYEFKSPEEGFAVNMEFFLLDSEYQCRKPSLYQYFKNHFNYAPYAEHACLGNSPVILSGSLLSESQLEIRQVDFNRLYEVHYLMATEGEHIVSRWGHSMLRLVMCDPRREVKGPECLTEDVSEHLVLSFRANIEGLVPYLWKAIQVGYPSQLFVMRLSDVIDEYTKDELRNLISVPLNLTDDQRSMLAYRGLEQLWAYQGQYTFFNKNCATEAASLLECCLDRECRSNFAPLDAWTPSGLYNQLFKKGWVEKNSIWDAQGNILDTRRAEVGGYLFKSKRDQLECTFQSIFKNKNNSVLYKHDFQNYLKNSTAFERVNNFQSILEAEHQSGSESGIQRRFQSKRKISSQFYVLESQIMRERKRGLIKKAGAYLIEPKAEVHEWSGRVQDWMSQSQPWNLISTGYGIPTETELLEVIESRLQSAQPELRQVQASLREQVVLSFPAEMEELNRIQSNLDYFLSEILKAS